MLNKKIVVTAYAVSSSSARMIGPIVRIAVAPQMAVPTPMRLVSLAGARSHMPNKYVQLIA